MPRARGGAKELACFPAAAPPRRRTADAEAGRGVAAGENSAAVDASTPPLAVSSVAAPSMDCTGTASGSRGQRRRSNGDPLCYAEEGAVSGSRTKHGRGGQRGNLRTHCRRSEKISKPGAAMRPALQACRRYPGSTAVTPPAASAAFKLVPVPLALRLAPDRRPARGVLVLVLEANLNDGLPCGDAEEEGSDRSCTGYLAHPGPGPGPRRASVIHLPR